MSGDRPFVSAEVARDQLAADLAVIDAAVGRLRDTSTDQVGNEFGLMVAARVETQVRTLQGLSYRLIGQIVDPPDGDPGPRVRDGVWRQLRITPGEVTRRVKLAARLRTRRTLTGEVLAAELPVLAAAVAAGQVGQDHIRAVCAALDVLPAAVPADKKAHAEQVLVEHAVAQDAAFVAAVGRGLADTLNPDGVFEDRDRAARRGLVLGRQGPDGMSRLAGWLTPSARAHLEAVAAAVRPGHHLPEAGTPVVDGATDTRTGPQRLHDAVEWGLKTGIESGGLGTHRGLPVTVIATTTLAALEQAAAAVTDPTIAMPAPARTGGGSALPMRELIAMAAHAIHYLVVFDNHSARPLYLGRSHRLASPDQRIVCYARDRGCTCPACLVPGYHAEVHHAVDWAHGGPTDADHLYFGCGPHHKAVTDGHYTTALTPDGHLAWTDGSTPPHVNQAHHPEQLLNDDDP
jgi:hypothetical protein